MKWNYRNRELDTLKNLEYCLCVFEDGSIEKCFFSGGKFFDLEGSDIKILYWMKMPELPESFKRGDV